jgi:hypothetical protein
MVSQLLNYEQIKERERERKKKLFVKNTHIKERLINHDLRERGRKYSIVIGLFCDKTDPMLNFNCDP